MRALDKYRRSYLKWLGVLPFAIILILLFILYPMAQNTINSMLPASILTTVFFLIPGLIVAYFLAKTYIGHGQHFFLWLSMAFFFTSCTGIIKWLPDVNTRTTINSCFFFMASLLCVFSISFIWNKLAGSRRYKYLIAVFGSGILLMATIYLLALEGVLPPFVNPQTGNTTLKVALNFTTGGLFAIAGIFYWVRTFKSGSSFFYWLSLGLLLAALGLIINGFGLSSSTFAAWFSMITMYLAGLYWLIATAVIFQEARAKGRGIPDIVTEFKRQSNELLVNAANDAIIAVDGMGRILTWNPAAEKMYGYQEQEIIGSSFFNLLHGVEEAISYQKQSEIFTSDKTANTIELKGRRKDGQEFSVELTLADRNMTRGWLPTITTTTTTLIIRDITERKKAEEKNQNQIRIIEVTNLILQQALSTKTEEQLGQFCLELAIELTESKYGFIYEITPSGLREIAIRHPGWDECQTIDKQGHHKLSVNGKICGLFGKVIIDGKSLLTNDPTHNPARIGIPEGHPPLDSFLGVPLKNQGKTVGIMGVSDREGGYTGSQQVALEQLTPAIIEALMRKRAEDALVDYKEELELKVEERTAALQACEEKYRVLIENASEAILVAQDGYLKLWNRKAMEISGWTEHELETKNFFEFILPEEREKASKIYQDSLFTEDIPSPYEIRAQMKDGSIRNLEIHLAKISWDDKPALLGLVADITDRKKAEKALNMLKTNLESANEQLKAYGRMITQVQEEERKRIAYELHDDTAQYLALLKLELDSLIQSDKIKDPKILEKLKFLESDAGRAVNDIRRYSHELRPGVLEHLGLLAALEQIAEDQNKVGRIKVEVNVEGDEPELSEDLRLGFFRIAQEAINNIRKHAKVTTAYINLEFTEDHVLMIIRDKGVGFDSQKTISRVGESGNLGLMSMQERAKLIGADLKVDSKLGQGTTVILEIHLDI